MSMQTLLEIDHNALHKIVERPEEFARLLDYALSSGLFDAHRDELWRFGVRLAGMKHSSGPWDAKVLERLP